IGGCNSGLYTRMKHASCPILDTDGNYVHLKTSILKKTHTEVTDENSFRKYIQKLSYAQNSCGMEALDINSVISSREVDPDNYRDSSPYRYLEANTLASQDVVTEPTFARDACFR